MRRVNRFIRNIVRTYELAKLTWNNCDCDHSEATDLFLYGLRRVVDHIEEHKNHVGWEYTVSRGRLILRLAEKVFNDEYVFEPYEKPLGFSEKEVYEEAQKKQEKANRIFWKLITHRLQWLWD